MCLGMVVDEKRLGIGRDEGEDTITFGRNKHDDDDEKEEYLHFLGNK